MSLGKKTIVVFFILGVCFCFGAYVALNLTVFPPFAEFEDRLAKDELDRVSQLLQSDLRALAVMNVEYSSWNDTYEYAQGRRPAYAEENIDPAYWHSLDIHLMALFDAEGNLLDASLGHPGTGDSVSLNDVFDPPLGAGHPLLALQNPEDNIAGMLQTRLGIMQVTSYPILRSNGTGPIAGNLIIGQFLTDGYVQELGARATAKVTVFSWADGNLPAMIENAKNAFVSSAEPIQVQVDGQMIHGLQMFRDVFGNPAAVVETQALREISTIGRNTVWTAMLFLAAASTVFILTAWLMTHRLITRPVTRLTELILGMRRSGDLSVDISTRRSDEVGVLAREFGELAVGLKAAQEDLERARDNALAMSDAKSEFLARMSHEIRTPMNGVLGMTELLRDTALNENQQRFAETIYESAESLLHIINDILDISKIEAGKIELDIAPFNLRNVVEECLELLAETAHSKGLELICNIPADTHTCVRGDAARLRQVLMNLVGNALKFTERGEIAVRVTECNKALANYRIEVSDTGIGVRSENAAKIFEPFSQEDGSTTRRYGGTGLGLSISKQLVELMGGEIGLDKAVGGGCVFWFTAQLPKDEATSELAQPDLFVGKSVLIVDDNATNREILRHQLESWRMLVTTVASGADALELLAGNGRGFDKIDVMLLDMSMPDMDGLQLAAQVRQLSGFANKPIVMLSSLSRADLSAEQMEMASHDWLTKPVRQSRLFDMLKSVLSNTIAEPEVVGTAPQDASIGEPVAAGLARILLADDNAVNCRVATEMLESLGYRATSVSDGQQALEAVKNEEFDIVLMDCRMPEMDGYDATRAIRQWEQDNGRTPIPIVALTANALPGDERACINAGMDGYLSKPFKKAELQAVIVAQLAQAKSQEETEFVRPPRKQGRVLIVDDNEVNQQVMTAMVASLGYESLAVSSGDEALNSLALESFDMVLMDCHMPGRDGYATTREIRRRMRHSAERRHVPIVAVTADFLERNRQECLDAGMDDYATKPITQEHLRQLLNRWVGNAESEQSGEALQSEEDGFSDFGDTIELVSVDRQVLREIRDLDPRRGVTVLREIVMSYCACSTKLMLQLRSSVDDGDGALIESVAHSLKGASSQIGAIGLAKYCGELIACAAGSDRNKCQTLCETIAIEHSSVITALEKELHAMAA